MISSAIIILVILIRITVVGRADIPKNSTVFKYGLDDMCSDVLVYSDSRRESSVGGALFLGSPRDGDMDRTTARERINGVQLEYTLVNDKESAMITEVTMSMHV